MTAPISTTGDQVGKCSFRFANCSCSPAAQFYYIMRPGRAYSQRAPTDSRNLNRSHIVEASLEKKDQLINKYQTEIHDLMEQIDSKHPRKANTILNTERSGRKQRVLSSMRKETIPSFAEADAVNNPMKDYQKLILGMEYALEGERNKCEELSAKNRSLESEISNLRNLLMGPDEHKHYEKTAFKESQDKINYLEARVIDQKKNYEFVIDAKNETMVSLEAQVMTLRQALKEKDGGNDKALSRKFLDLMNQLEEMKAQLTRKNIQIERLKYQKQADSESDDEEVKKIRKAERVKFYLEQLEIANKLILKKNVEVLMLSNKVMNYEKIMDVMEMYLDKKEVRGVDLAILEHSCVNKLRMLLREKAVFEKELLSQLNDHNKKINNFESEILGRDKLTSEKMSEVISDNKRLANTVANLQSTVATLEGELEHSRADNEMLTTQITINKREFIEEVTKLKEELGAISSVTKSEFDRMKIENLKLSEQNRSLLFLVGEKEREIHKKGEAMKTFEEYREKINTLGVGDKDRRKIEMVSEGAPQIGTKLLLINSFSNWLFEWNKIKNWANKKTLLNLILDKEEIRADALESLPLLINVLHECLLQSRNVEIQERATILVSQFIQQGLLKNPNLYLGKIVPVMVRGFRPIIEGEEESKNRALNEAALRICSQLERDGFRWNHEMTNEMLSVNGLKYLFSTIRNTQVDELVESAFNILIMIAKENEMISFMMSFDLNTLIFTNLNAQYTFIIFLLSLVRALLDSDDYLRAQTSLLEYRKLFDLLASDDDEELLEITLDCLLLLMEKNALFTRSVDKIKAISILSLVLRKSNDECTFLLLKKAGKAYAMVLTELESENINKYTKLEVDKILEVVRMKKSNELRFSRGLKVLAKVASIVHSSHELDEKLFAGVSELYSHYESIETESRVKMNEILNSIFERNKEIVNKYSNETLLGHLVEAYKLATNHEELIFLLKILLFEQEQKKSTEILRSGRETFIGKLISDSLAADYNITIAALKVLLLLSKEKYSQKFINKAIMGSLVNKVLNERGEEEYIGLTLSAMYFFCKSDVLSEMAIDAGIVAKLCNVILERHDKEQIIYKSLAVLEVCHSTHYKKKILNYLIANDSNLQILKTLSFILRKAKNKVEMGSRAVFIYDFLNGKTTLESLAILTERNEWMVEDLVMLRNEYVAKVDSLVYKIQMLLHEMSKVSNKVRRLYQKFKVAGGESEED